MIDLAGIARVFHVLAVVVWIGGVAMITGIVLPLARSSSDPEERQQLVESIERRFAWIARAMVSIVGASGFYMIWAFDLWSRFTDPAFWWMHAMVAVWSIFMAILFIAEPLLKTRMKRLMTRDPRRVLGRILRVHWVLLTAALITIAGAVAGAHGYRLFQ